MLVNLDGEMGLNSRLLDPEALNLVWLAAVWQPISTILHWGNLRARIPSNHQISPPACAKAAILRQLQPLHPIWSIC